LAIAARFIADPLKAPDASCLATMPRLAFDLPESGPATLTFAITSDAPSAFAGRWQAAFGGSIEYAFDLKIEGGQIAGAIRTSELTVPIRDGRAGDSEIRFNVTSPSGERVIRFVGMLEGDRVLFTREVEVRPGGSPGGAAIFGAASRHWFTARRAK
jgi:hypothetical protein